MSEKVTPQALYFMAMESDTAGNLMHVLCRLLGTPYPPEPDDRTEIKANQQPAMLETN